MNFSIFKPSDSIYSLTFLHNVETNCDNDVSCDGTVMCLLPHFMKVSSNSAVLYVVSTTEVNGVYKEKTWTTHCQVDNYLIVAYEADDDNAEADAYIVNYE